MGNVSEKLFSSCILVGISPIAAHRTTNPRKNSLYRNSFLLLVTNSRTILPHALSTNGF